MFRNILDSVRGLNNMTEQGRKFMLELIKCSQHRRLDTYDGSVV